MVADKDPKLSIRSVEFEESEGTFDVPMLIFQMAYFKAVVGVEVQNNKKGER